MFKALNGLLSTDVPLRNYSLTHWLLCLVFHVCVICSGGGCIKPAAGLGSAWTCQEHLSEVCFVHI